MNNSVLNSTWMKFKHKLQNKFFFSFLSLQRNLLCVILNTALFTFYAVAYALNVLRVEVKVIFSVFWPYFH